MSENLWDEASKDYRQRYHLPDQFIWDEASWPRIQFDGYMDVVLRLLPPPPGQLLDVGCGPGLGASRLARAGFDVTGIDYNTRAIAFGRLLTEDVDLRERDIRTLNEADDLHERFDVAVSVEVLEHVPPVFHAQVIEGVWRALRPGGVFIVSVPSTRLPVSRWDYMHFNAGELQELLARARFDVEQVIAQGEVNLLCSPFVWRAISNRFWDLKVLRRLIRRIYLGRYNLASPQRAGRFIARARKP